VGSFEEMKFELTKNHIKLLRNMYFDYDDYTETGAPYADPKRPYGNSSVVYDVYEIIFEKRWEATDDEDEMDDELQDELMQLHYETATALQIVLAAKSFEPGIYELADPRDRFSWRKVE
jgi:hypothetical protein